MSYAQCKNLAGNAITFLFYLASLWSAYDLWGTQILVLYFVKIFFSKCEYIFCTSSKCFSCTCGSEIPHFCAVLTGAASGLHMPKNHSKKKFQGDDD